MQADFVAGRCGQNDAEFLFAVFKLLHRIGTGSTTGYHCVMKVKDLWRKLRQKFILNKKKLLPVANATPLKRDNNDNNNNDSDRKNRSGIDMNTFSMMAY